MIEARTNNPGEETQKNQTPETITVTMILEDLDNGIDRNGIKDKYSLETWEVKQMFEHPALKGKKARKVRKLSFNFVDDTTPDPNQTSIEVEAPDVKSPEQFLYERIMELDILEIASKNILQTFLKIFYNLTSENLFIGSIVCGDSLQLFSTLDPSFSAPKKLLFGYPVVEIKEFEPSTVLLLITDKKNPELPDYKSVIKLSLGEA